eukprot:gnl/MRDRNA2_/MRDRNA2_27972_c0_seq1.p1 gnl/MRDRNA2_/MRDRNA2_27972_c0~~gnl/MRDRNA2_/MRDRNA2_27972_c0_seq1.p1  ORF type:complete len:777 (-),score=98.44 gnl/MRDRNA2_/MRDRNA2_27972_c0_seq1:87-2417(-)
MPRLFYGRKGLASVSTKQICPLPGVSAEDGFHNEHVLPKPDIRSYPNVTWQWQHHENWREYDDKQKNRMEYAYERGAAHLRLKSGKTGAVPMEIFFDQMIQYDPASGNHRAIRRLGPDPFLMRLRRKFLGMFHHHSATMGQNVTFDQYKAYAEVHAGAKITPEMREALASTNQKMELFANTHIAHVVRSQRFELMQMVLIVCNTVWLGYDADRGSAPSLTEEPGWYQFMAHLWCSLFSLELLVRFLAYKSVRHAAQDTWFLFDSALVTLIVLETWIVLIFSMALGMKNWFVLRLVRILRLTRIGRIARFLRTMPEVMTLLKGISTALRSVFFTFVLLVCFLFVFGMLFTTHLDGEYGPSHPDSRRLGEKTDGEPVEEDQFGCSTNGPEQLDVRFGTLPEAMWTLLVTGIFFDGFADVINLLRMYEPFLAVLFLFFVFICSFTVLNMLVGIICEVASTVSTEEQEEASIQYLRNTLLELMECYDIDDDRHIRRDEFELLLKNPEACLILSSFGVNVNDLISLKDHLFEQREFYDEALEDQQVSENSQDTFSAPQKVAKKWRKISFAEFLSIVLRLRGGNKATVIDIVDLRDYLNDRLHAMEDKLASATVVNRLIANRAMHEYHHNHSVESAKECAEVLHEKFHHSHPEKPTTLVQQPENSNVPLVTAGLTPGMIPVAPVVPTRDFRQQPENFCIAKPSPALTIMPSSGGALPSADMSTNLNNSYDMHQLLLNIHQQLAVVHHEQTQLRLAHESMSKEMHQIRRQFTSSSDQNSNMLV